MRGPPPTIAAKDVVVSNPSWVVRHVIDQVRWAEPR